MRTSNIVRREIFPLAPIFMMAAILAGCSGASDPPEVSKDKLTLLYQTLVDLPYDVGGAEKHTRFEVVNGTPHVKASSFNEDEYVDLFPTEDKCTFKVLYMASGRQDASFEINLNNVYMENPRVVANDAGWYFGIVQFEDGAITHDTGGDSVFKVKSLGARLNRGDTSDINMWQNRLVALRKYCPGR